MVFHRHPYVDPLGRKPSRTGGRQVRLYREGAAAEVKELLEKVQIVGGHSGWRNKTDDVWLQVTATAQIKQQRP